MRVSEIIKKADKATFSFYRQGYLYYEVALDGVLYVFPVEVSDLAGATCSAVEKPITLMRYIRKAVDGEMFVRSGDTASAR